MPEHVRAALSIKMQMSSEEVACLAALAGQVPGELRIVEIGSYQGGSTCVLALAAAHGGKNYVYAVDPHTPFVGPRGGVYGPADLKKLYENITRLGLGEQICVASLPSTAAAKGWGTRDIGLLWIDGDHTYAGVRGDIEAWGEHVVAVGIIALHDSDLPDVERAIDEALAAGVMRPLGRADKIRWFERA